METASVVFEHSFDAAMLEQIDTLRTIRLNLAEKMLKDLEGTCAALVERGLIEGPTVSTGELRQELQARIKTLRERLAKPHVVFEDEIELYVDLIDADDDLEDALD